MCLLISIEKTANNIRHYLPPPTPEKGFHITNAVFSSLYTYVRNLHLWHTKRKNSYRTLGNGSYFLLRVQRYKVRDSYTIFFGTTYQQEIKKIVMSNLYIPNKRGFYSSFISLNVNIMIQSATYHLSVN